MILNARNVIIDKSGPKKTTMKVTELENNNLSKILLKPSIFFCIYNLHILLL